MCRACPTVPDDVLSAVAADPNGSIAMPERPTSAYIVWFDQYTEEDEPRVGGKNASLGALTNAGLPVPPGFAVTTEAYETLRSHPDLRALVHRTLDEADHDDAGAMREASRLIRAAIEELRLPDDVADGVRQSYAVLCDLCAAEDVPVAVRSSATAEDLPDASFAGQQDTFLWVRGVDAVLAHVRRCWSSVFTDRAISYRRRLGYDDTVIDMSVGVQKMVEPKAAGVAFTLNPSNGDRSQVAIDASWGFGEAVVAGEVTPDNFLVDKVLREVTTRAIATKTVEYCLQGDGIERVELTGERATAPCLTDEEICAVAAMARRAEKHYGRPQDIEWAIDRHLPAGQDVVLLQSRPETVWSHRRREVSHDTGMDSIVKTLVAPLTSRGS